MLNSTQQKLQDTEPVGKEASAAPKILDMGQVPSLDRIRTLITETEQEQSRNKTEPKVKLLSTHIRQNADNFWMF